MNQRIIASPLARKIAQDKGLDLTTIQGSGPNGRIILRDVNDMRPQPAQAAGAPIASAPTSPTASGLPDPRPYAIEGQFDEIPLSPMQTSIANRLVQSMQAMPHFYLTRRLPVDKLLR